MQSAPALPPILAPGRDGAFGLGPVLSGRARKLWRGGAPRSVGGGQAFRAGGPEICGRPAGGGACDGILGSGVAYGRNASSEGRR